MKISFTLALTKSKHATSLYTTLYTCCHFQRAVDLNLEIPLYIYAPNAAIYCMILHLKNHHLTLLYHFITFLMMQSIFMSVVNSLIRRSTFSLFSFIYMTNNRYLRNVPFRTIMISHLQSKPLLCHYSLLSMIKPILHPI